MASEINYGHKAYAIPVHNPFQLLANSNPIATRVDTPRPKYSHSMTPLQGSLQQSMNQTYLTKGAEASVSDKKENKRCQKKVIDPTNSSNPPAALETSQTENKANKASALCPPHLDTPRYQVLQKTSLPESTVERVKKYQCRICHRRFDRLVNWLVNWNKHFFCYP